MPVSIMLDLDNLFVLVPEAFAAAYPAPADQPQEDNDHQNRADDAEPGLVHVRFSSVMIILPFQPERLPCDPDTLNPCSRRFIAPHFVSPVIRGISNQPRPVHPYRYPRAQSPHRPSSHRAHGNSHNIRHPTPPAPAGLSFCFASCFSFCFARVSYTDRCRHNWKPSCVQQFAGPFPRTRRDSAGRPGIV
jgi:hypothetical protein